MRKIRKCIQNGIVSLLSLLLVVGTAACSSEETSSPPAASGQSAEGQSAQGQETPKSGGILRFSRTQDAVNLDPIKPLENLSIWTVVLIYDTLVRTAPDGNGYEPGLATDWTISPDGKKFVFNLRKDVKFHNGMPVTAEDVKFSLDRARSKDSNWNWLYTTITSVDITGENQVTIKTNEPYAPMLSNLALFAAAIVPEKVVKEKGNDYLANNPIGSGPFVFEQWQRGQKMSFKKNPDYWQKGKPYLDGVEFVQEAEDTTRLLKLSADEIDVASDVPYSSIATLKASPNVNVQQDPLAGINLIHINNTIEPFNDPKIRQAMNYAVDRNAIIQTVLMGNGKSATSYLPRVLYYDDKLPSYEYNLEKAKQLMAESSKPNGFKTTLTINSGNEIYRQLAVILKQELMAIGIDIEIAQLEPGTKEENLNAMKYEIAAGYVTSDVIDPDELTTYEVVSDSGTKSFFTGYKNPKVDELAVKARGELDEGKRKEMYAEIQKIVKDDAPFIFLFEQPSSYATSKNVKGFKVMTTGNYRLEDVWLNK
ncbi:ABC transporter substrate-binding protein [Brevibacillus choshinensis]|uniref:ABC transporter substrate-binding protein n=1 Tax=Brevibacillus choshinensis TaxID=54911 RepID=UPI0006EBEFA9|nr:ABC transporter substrate-binding protein [Brevibacillus choshinensis]